MESFQNNSNSNNPPTYNANEGPITVDKIVLDNLSNEKDKDEYIKLVNDLEKKNLQIKQLYSQVQSLNVSLDVLKQNSNFFDSQDFSIIQKCINKKMEQIKNLETNYNKHINHLLMTVMIIKKTVDTRRKILENLDKDMQILKSDKELKNFFVHKHFELLKLLDDAKSQLKEH
jgi:hypothetical protein